MKAWDWGSWRKERSPDAGYKPESGAFLWVLLPNFALLNLGYLLGIAIFFVAANTANAEDNKLQVGLLNTYGQCVDASLQNDLADENQRYWFPRKPPFVGFSKGEKTTAGGDGTCYLGFPNASKSSGIIQINNVIIEVHPEGTATEGRLTFKSKAGDTHVVVQVTGSDSTCSGDSCCGDYKYATLTVTHKGKTVRLKAANYQGS